MMAGDDIGQNLSPNRKKLNGPLRSCGRVIDMCVLFEVGFKAISEPQGFVDLLEPAASITWCART